MEGYTLKRLEFGIKYLNKPLSFWWRILFTDESLIERGGGTYHSRSYR
jgi:hypothetical protein